MRGRTSKYALRRPAGFIPFDLEFRLDVGMSRQLIESRMSKQIDSDQKAAPIDSGQR